MLNYLKSTYLDKIRFYLNLRSNLNTLKKIKISENIIKSHLSLFDKNIYDINLSWHFHFFGGASKLFNKNLKILEIGTHDGTFANFLSQLSFVEKIYTIDLHETDLRFINTYGRKNSEDRKRFIKIRNINLKSSKIKFIEMDSNNILEIFKKEKFDLIWIDGDHFNPQVSNDINNSLELIQPNGFILCDDVIIKNENYFKQSNSDSFRAINELEEKKVINVRYILKRLKYKKYKKKFIAIITKN